MERREREGQVDFSIGGHCNEVVVSAKSSPADRKIKFLFT